jgi:RNA polymerase sigma-70 factor (ECF subfamily)
MRVSAASEAASAEDLALLDGLRAGDESAFTTLVARHTPTMLAVARTYVRTRAVAEEVVQEAWVGVLKGIDQFEGRSSLRTWILRIVANIAMTRGVREARSVPFSSFGDDADPIVDADRFRAEDETYPGHWRTYPSNWSEQPEDALLGAETLQLVQAAIDELPEVQRAVITLRDLNGWTPEEVCEALDLTDGNQRVLLHRARGRVRSALEGHFDA